MYYVYVYLHFCQISEVYIKLRHCKKEKNIVYSVNISCVDNWN